MNHRFVPKKFAERDAKPEVNMECDHERCVTVMKYPPINPQDRIDEEYDDDRDGSE